MLAIQSPEERASRVPATTSSQWREQMVGRPLMEDLPGLSDDATNRMVAG